MKNLEDIKKLLSEAGFKEFEGSSIDYFIKHYIPYNDHEGQHEYFFDELYLVLYQTMNIGRKEIIDSI